MPLLASLATGRKNEIEHIDVMIDDFLDFDIAYNNREVVSAKGIEISVISIDDLIELKRMAGRQRDIMDIKALQKIKELKDDQK